MRAYDEGPEPKLQNLEAGQVFAAALATTFTYRLHSPLPALWGVSRRCSQTRSAAARACRSLLVQWRR